MSTISNLSKSPPEPRSSHAPQSQVGNQLDEETDEQQQAEEDDLPYPEPSPEQTLLPPPGFRPFFTVIEDTTSGEHYHPYVHYVFADDDPIITTATSMRGLGLDDTKYLPQDAAEDIEGPPDHEDDEEEQRSPVESPLPPPIPGVKEHYIIVDVGADGRTIVDAQSLSSEWQITGANVRIAPSFDESLPDQGYMLRVEGVQIAKKNKGKGKSEAGQDKLSVAREQNQGDIFGALDALVRGIEGDLEIAAKISGSRLKDTVERPLADVPTEEEEGNAGDV